MVLDHGRYSGYGGGDSGYGDHDSYAHPEEDPLGAAEHAEVDRLYGSVANKQEAVERIFQRYREHALVYLRSKVTRAEMPKADLDFYEGIIRRVQEYEDERLARDLNPTVSRSKVINLLERGQGGAYVNDLIRMEMKAMKDRLIPWFSKNGIV